MPNCICFCEMSMKYTTGNKNKQGDCNFCPLWRFFRGIGMGTTESHFLKEMEILFHINVKWTQRTSIWMTEQKPEIQYNFLVTNENRSSLKYYYDKLWLKDSSSVYIPSVLSAQEQNFGDRFLHVFLQNGRPVAKLGCSDIHVLTAVAPQNIRNNSLVPIIVR